MTDDTDERGEEYVARQRSGDHLPECTETLRRNYAFCICDRLRACEARAWGQGRADHAEAVSTAYGKGLDAARDAVAALEAIYAPTDNIAIPSALAAIDGLREESQR